MFAVHCRINRYSALHNVCRQCPSFATNYYRAPSDLFIDGEIISSQEGATQGDPLAMPLCPSYSSFDKKITQFRQTYSVFGSLMMLLPLDHYDTFVNGETLLWT